MYINDAFWSILPGNEAKAYAAFGVLAAQVQRGTARHVDVSDPYAEPRSRRQHLSDARAGAGGLRRGLQGSRGFSPASQLADHERVLRQERRVVSEHVRTDRSLDDGADAGDDRRLHPPRSRHHDRVAGRGALGHEAGLPRAGEGSAQRVRQPRARRGADDADVHRQRRRHVRAVDGAPAVAAGRAGLQLVLDRPEGLLRSRRRCPRIRTF